MVKVEDKLAKAVDCLEYFTTNQWRFYNSNVRELAKILEEKDRQTFIVDVKSLTWEKYIEYYVLGFREYLFKQEPSSLPASRKNMTR